MLCDEYLAWTTTVVIAWASLRSSTGMLSFISQSGSNAFYEIVDGFCLPNARLMNVCYYLPYLRLR
jgi:hypothetical protein